MFNFLQLLNDMTLTLKLLEYLVPLFSFAAFFLALQFLYKLRLFKKKKKKDKYKEERKEKRRQQSQKNPPKIPWNYLSI